MWKPSLTLALTTLSTVALISDATFFGTKHANGIAFAPQPFPLTIRPPCAQLKPHRSFIVSHNNPWDKSLTSLYANDDKSSEKDSPVAEAAGYRMLYAPSDAHTNGTIQVDSLHTIYYQEHGLRAPDFSKENAESFDICTALFLHGGPGAGCTTNHARFFDPAKYRIVLLDQRGSGRSTPRGEVRNNTLQHLVHDCEVLRTKLGISRWDVVLGGSWGSTLAIAYAQSSPESVGSLVLRGVCTMRRIEVDWLFNSRGGAAALNPQGWAEFEAAVDVGNKTESTPRAALHAYYDRLLGEDASKRLEAAWSWFKWEMRVASLMSNRTNTTGNVTSETLRPQPVLVWETDSGWGYQHTNGSSLSDGNSTDGESKFQNLRKFAEIPLVDENETDQIRPVQPLPQTKPAQHSSESDKGQEPRVPAQSMITCFFSVNNKHAMNDLELLSKERINRIREIPCIAVQGALDLICPVDTALDLVELWPEMELRIPCQAGHSMYDPAITNELVRATDRLAKVEKNDKK